MDSLREQGNTLSETAISELRVVLDAVDEILNLSMLAYRNDDKELAKRIEPLEEVIDDMTEEMKYRHVYRMSHNECDPFAEENMSISMNFIIRKTPNSGGSISTEERNITCGSGPYL